MQGIVPNVQDTVGEGKGRAGHIEKGDKKEPVGAQSRTPGNKCQKDGITKQGSMKGRVYVHTEKREEEKTLRKQKQETGKELKKLQKDIKGFARKDKKGLMIDQFRENNEDIHKKHRWKAIKT